MASKLQKNTLIRYKNIRDIYMKYKTDDIPDTVILRKYIYPIHAISRSTLNTVLGTQIDKLLLEFTDHGR